ELTEAVDEGAVVEQLLRPREQRQPIERELAMQWIADQQPLVTDQCARDGPALVEPADQVLAWHAHSVEEDLAEILLAGDVADAAPGDAGRLQVDQQE